MKQEKCHGYRYEQAVIGFGGTPTLWWMRFLKKGFYHCVIAIGAERQWILIDPLLHYTDTIVIDDGDVEKFLHKQGYQTLRVFLEEPLRHFRLRPYTCVETAKRFLGLDAPNVWTPYQLYLFLTKNRKIILDKEIKIC